MGSEPKTPPKLSLMNISSRPSMPAELSTPPPRTPASVPFQWEEAPGKPRPCHTRSQPVARTLELPPRLLLLPSPTTLLDWPSRPWPSVARAMSFASSYSKKNHSGEGSFDFSSWTVEGAGKVNITRVKRKGSFSNLSQGSSNFWTSIYESFKQVVPWKRRLEKQRKKASFDL